LAAINLESRAALLVAKQVIIALYSTSFLNAFPCFEDATVVGGCIMQVKHPVL